MSLDLVQTLSELVAIPSVNPMGKKVSGPIYLETRVTDYLEDLFRRLGVAYERQPVEPGRANIVARIDGRVPAEQGGPLLLWDAHQDTVPVEGMTIPPFTPEVREGRIYGRGACDIKGGMAAMLAAFARLAQERPPQMPTLIMACTVNEEHGFSGATRLTRCWTEPLPSIIPRRPDAAIVAEPTLLDVVVAHKGALRWDCYTRGKASHSSQPHLGENAIYRMARVALAFEKYHREVLPQIPAHPLCGQATLNVGTIDGGLSVNTVPDYCVIEIDRRLLPGEDGRTAYAAALRWFQEEAGLDFPVEHETPWMWGSTLNDRDNQTLAARLAAVSRGVCGRSAPIGVPYGTNASQTSLAGVPSVVFGPGSIDQAHTTDEWLAIDQLEMASEAYYRFAVEGG